jgi:hypothetical protein
MSGAAAGGAPVGRLAELAPLEARVIRYVRLWSAGDDGQAAVLAELGERHGPAAGRALGDRFRDLVDTTLRHARRPLMRHALDCPCAGADECVFARFVALAAEGEREDAVLIAALMVRADVALGLVRLAEEIGLGLMRGQALRVIQ